VGDGSTNVVNLPFIDAGTINGDSLPESEVIMYSDRNSFPSSGQENKLYIDLSTSKIYCFISGTGYSLLSNFTYTTEKTTVSHITYWRAGAPTTLSCSGGVLRVSSGLLPSLNHEGISVVREITKESGTT